MPAAPKRLAEELNLIWDKYPKGRPLIVSGRPLIHMVRKDRAFKIPGDKTPQLNNWNHILDHVLSWFYVCTKAFELGSSPKKETVKHGSLLMVLATILNSALAIQELCGRGFDLPAKQVL